MRLILLISITVSLVIPDFSIGQQQSSEQINIYNDVAFLAHDSLEGREMGTAGELIAARYIASRFEQIGLEAMNDSYFQTFSRKMNANPHDTTNGIVVNGRNVVGVLAPGKSSTIIIGAHYDHLGWGGKGSGSLSTEHAIHNGADDNASGIAGLLYLAEYFSNFQTEHNIVFVAFTGEEKGLLGSNFFAKNTLAGMGEISFMINMDMIGRLDEDRRLAVYGIGTSPEFVPAMESIATPEFQIVMDSSGIGPSDHTSFYLQDIPVLHFFTGQHEQYHKPEDDVEYINFEGLKDVVDYISQLVIDLDSKDDLTFTKTKDNRAKNEKRTFNVTLGVIPDYLFEGEGLKIDGVKSDRTADVAGIQKGDILLKIGKFEVKNIYDYMESLGYYHPGDSVSATILRDEEKIELEVTFIE